jgi:uncharacterized membrane protein YphA (DoxX/SURF4 family)
LAEGGALFNWLRRLGFRFWALYLIVYNLGGIAVVPGLGFVGWLNHNLWRTMVPWIAREILRLEKPVAMNFTGSGDTLYNYVEALGMAIVALGVALVWVWFDRNRRYDGKLREGTRTLVRYILGITMLSYGMLKILHQQMPAPMLHQLIVPYSEFSPMGLLWRFMGYSAAYSFFAGLMEIVGGLLLFFRRTTTLGAIVTSAVMVNVVLMNFCFDVPVKLYSIHLLAFALYLAAPDYCRLVDLLFWHRAVPSVSFTRNWPTPFVRRGVWMIKAIILGVILYHGPVERIQAWLQAPRPRPELYGLYEVREFIRDDKVLSSASGGGFRWRRVIITEYGVMVDYMDDRRAYYTATSSLKDHKLTFRTREATPRVFEFTVERTEPELLMIEGVLEAHRLTIELRRVDETKFQLLSRGFHWISEFPYNR